MCFKILHGLVDVDLSEFFIVNSDTRTRGHSLKLVGNRFRLDIAKYFFSNRVINSWNALPDSLVNCNSVVLFREKLCALNL